MLDIILGNTVFDFGLNFQAGSSHPGYFVNGLLGGKRANYVSEVEKVLTKMNTDYDKLYYRILELD